MEEEDFNYISKDAEKYIPSYQPPEPLHVEPIPLCTCILDNDSVVISPRKQLILTTVARTESYLRERRIPELIRFLLTKVIVQATNKPIAYLEKLLNDCMLARAGHIAPPVLYEDCHLKAVIKSFDPLDRGWLSAGQFRRAYITVGLTPPENIPERIPVDEAFHNLHQAQDFELMSLLSAGNEAKSSCFCINSQSDSTI